MEWFLIGIIIGGIAIFIQLIIEKHKSKSKNK